MSSNCETPDVSEIFACNLRDLVADAASISAVCRALDINRTQFNRYLSGEAHPRPEVLRRICDHFHCDARILLTPLAEIRRDQAAGWPFAPAPNPYQTLRTEFDHARMPDGLYQIILPNMVEPGTLVVEMLRLFTTRSGVKGMQWGVHKPYVESIGASTRWYDRKFTGFVQQHVDGVSLLATNPLSRLPMLCFVTYGFRGMPTIYTGFAAMTQAAGPLQRQFQPLMIRRLPPDCASILKARRQHRRFELGMLPQVQRQFFETWNAA